MKQIPGIPYYVDKDGRIYSEAGRWNSRITEIKGFLNASNVRVFKIGRNKCMSFQRAMALAFHTPPHPKARSTVIDRSKPLTPDNVCFKL